MKTPRTHLLLFGIFILVVAASRQATAQFQDSMGTGWNNAMSASASTMIWNSIFYRTTGSGTTRTKIATPANTTSNRAQPAPAPQQNKPVDEAAMRFKFTGSYIKTKELADQLGSTQEQRDQYYALMNAVLQGFDQQAAGANHPHDIALALSYFLAENLRVFHGQPDLSNAQFLQIRDAIASALSQTGAVKTFTDRQKQEMYETLVAYTGITQYGYEEALKAGNQQIAQAYQKVAAQNLQTVTKRSPDEINLDPNGGSAEGGAQESASPASRTPIDIFQLRHDYNENAVRADQIYKGKRFVFTGTVVEVSGKFYKTTGKDETGRYIYTDIGPNLRVSNTAGTVIGWEVHCFFKDKNQLAQLRGQQPVRFEATVEGSEDGSTTLVLVDAVLR